VTLLGQGVGLGDPQRALPTPAMLGCWDSVMLCHRHPLRFGSASPQRTQSRERRMGPDRAGTHGDTQGHTTLSHPPSSLPQNSAPLPHPPWQPLTPGPGAALAPGSHGTSPQQAATAGSWEGGRGGGSRQRRDKGVNKGNDGPFTSAVGLALQQAPTLQRPGVPQHPGISAAGKSHPHPRTSWVTPDGPGPGDAGVVCSTRPARLQRHVPGTGSRGTGSSRAVWETDRLNTENLNFTTPAPCRAVMLEVGTGFLID